MLYYLNRRYTNARPFPGTPYYLLCHESHKKSGNFDEILEIDDVYPINKERIFPFRSINHLDRFE